MLILTSILGTFGKLNQYAKNMKALKIAIVITISIILSSCLTHYFIEPVPSNAKAQKSMPKPLIGQWNKGNEKHTIDKQKWINQYEDSTGTVKTSIEYELSDSMIIKKAGKYYFVNSLEENGYWTVYLGFKEKNHFYIKGLSDTDTLNFVTILNLKPDSTVKDKELYYNKPLTRRQMRKFVKQGGFTDTLIVFDIANRTVEN